MLFRSPRWHVSNQRDWAALGVLLLSFAIVSAIAEPIDESVIRHNEHAADVYGQEAIHGIVVDPQETARTTFNVLGENTLDEPNPNKLIEIWTYSHPASGRRAAFGKAYDPWAPGMEPKYFKK